MMNEMPIFRPAAAFTPQQGLNSQPGIDGARDPPSTRHIGLAIKACRTSYIFGSLLLLFAVYLAWRALVMWNEARLEKQRLKDNRIWMRAERIRRGAKIVGILSSEGTERVSRREQMMKRVRFVEALEGMTAGDVTFDHAVERRLNRGEGMC